MTVEQRDLFAIDVEDLVPTVDVDLPTLGTHDLDAQRFHEQNPHIMRACIKLARYVRERGARHYGIGAVWEVLRFKALESHGDIYKLNNNYRAWFSREVMRQAPDLAGFFETRRSPHDPEYHQRKER